MKQDGMGTREGGLEAPTRHPIDWQSKDFYNQEKLDAELERVFDICHGCRRCVSLCESFPTLFDLIDESENFDVESVDPSDYPKVSEQCYLCDLCYQTKCPYVPPHPWQVDFPHLMLRAKAVKFSKNGSGLRDRIISSTDTVGGLASKPMIRPLVNTMKENRMGRVLLEKTLGIHHQARLPDYASGSRLKKLRSQLPDAQNSAPETAGPTRGRVAIFASCHGNWSQPEMVEDMLAVLQHNGIEARLLPKEQCCGMPKLELGNLPAVQRARDVNIPILLEAVESGWDILSPIPSCVLMFRREFPLLFADDSDVLKVAKHCFDPFEYLFIRHQKKLFNTNFVKPLGKVAYQVACHQRVQNIGNRTRDILELIPDSEIELIERCSGHDGTYAVRKETHENAMKIARPVAKRVQDCGAPQHTSDCPLAADHIGHSLGQTTRASHPISLLRGAYGI